MCPGESDARAPRRRLACLPGRCAVCAAALGLRAQFCEDHAKPDCTEGLRTVRDVAPRSVWATPAFCFKTAPWAASAASCGACSTCWLKSLIGLVFAACSGGVRVAAGSLGDVLPVGRDSEK